MAKSAGFKELNGSKDVMNLLAQLDDCEFEKTGDCGGYGYLPEKYFQDE